MCLAATRGPVPASNERVMVLRMMVRFAGVTPTMLRATFVLAHLMVRSLTSLNTTLRATASGLATVSVMADIRSAMVSRSAGDIWVAATAAIA